jgi:hypothetical protein
MFILLYTVWVLCCAIFTFNAYSRDNTVATGHSSDKITHCTRLMGCGWLQFQNNKEKEERGMQVISVS